MSSGDKSYINPWWSELLYTRPYTVAFTGTTNCTTTELTYENLMKTYNKLVGKEEPMACPICGATAKRDEFIKTFDKQGNIKKTKTVQTFRCGTRRTGGDLETEKPRIKIGKDCAQPAE